jgi:hypothetical protein
MNEILWNIPRLQMLQLDPNTTGNRLLNNQHFGNFAGQRIRTHLRYSRRSQQTTGDSQQKKQRGTQSHIPSSPLNTTTDTKEALDIAIHRALLAFLRCNKTASKNQEKLHSIEPVICTLEKGIDATTQGRDGSDDRDCNQRDQQSILNHRRSALITNKTTDQLCSNALKHNKNSKKETLNRCVRMDQTSSDPRIERHYCKAKYVPTPHPNFHDLIHCAFSRKPICWLIPIKSMDETQINLARELFPLLNPT